MPKNIELLLTETVDNLGIVGDVVHVKPGYARNFLLPRAMAVEPTEAAKKALADRRAAEQERLSALRTEMERVCEKLEGYEVTLERSCNDNGWLYGSVTQHDIMEALHADGFELVQERHIRIGAAIKRVDSYELPVQFDQDLKTEIKLWVVPDREIPALRSDEESADETDEESVEASVEGDSSQTADEEETATAE